MAGAAQAQTVDWLVNIDDDAFENTPALGTVEYIVSAANNGFGAAPATTLEFVVPTGTSFTGFTPAATGLAITNCTPLPAASGATVTCDVPALADAFDAVNSVASVTLDIETTEKGVIFLTVDVQDPTNVDDDDNNNDLTEQTTIIEGSDIAVTIAPISDAPAGSTVDFVVTATNNGPDDSNGFEVEFAAPAGIESFTAPAGYSCSLSGATYTCTVPGIVAVGGSVDLTFSGQVVVASGSTVSADVSVNNNDPSDEVAENNIANTDFDVTPGTDTYITKTRNTSGTVYIGDTVSWTLQPGYTGESPTSIVVTDVLPSNYTFTGVTSIPSGAWSCAEAAGTVTCTRASGGAVGVNVSLDEIEITATVNAAGLAVNEVEIAAGGPPEQNTSNNTATDSGGVTIVVPVVDLASTKTGPAPEQVIVGNSYTFSLRARNVGNVGFTGTAVLTDSIPDGMTVTGYTLNGWTCDQATPVVGPQDIVCTRDYTDASPLAANANTPYVQMTTLINSEGSNSNELNNVVVVSTVDPNYPDENAANDEVEYVVEVQTLPNSADISVVKRTSPRIPTTIQSGEQQTFYLEIVNADPVSVEDSTDIDITDTLNNLANASATGSNPGIISVTTTPNNAIGLTCDPLSGSGTSATLNCHIDTLPQCVAQVGETGESGTVLGTCPIITVVVRAGGDAGTYSNTFSAESQGQPDPDYSNDEATVSYGITALTDITVAKSSNPETQTVAGQTLEYIVSAQVVNDGRSGADDVTITDTLPAGLTFISATKVNSGDACETVPNTTSPTGAGNNQVVCEMGTIGNGGQSNVRILVRPNNVTRGTVITNNVVVTTTTTEDDVEPNFTSDDVTVMNPELDLRVNKSDRIGGTNYDPVAVGDQVFYLITVENSGPSASENLIVTDSMPTSRISFQAATPSAGGTCTTVPAVGSFGGTLICEWPTLLATDEVTILVEGEGAVKGSIANNVSIDSDEIDRVTPANNFDIEADNNDTFEETTVRSRADIEAVSKTAVPGTVNLYDDFIFEILIRANSTGPSSEILGEADDVTVTDQLPSNMRITGTPTAVVQSGTASSTVCTGVVGTRDVSCDLGTISAGGSVLISVPAEVTDVTSNPETVSNTATVTTTSLDVVTTNNSTSGDVIVQSSEISGYVFRDFADDGLQTAGDTGVQGITITLTGVSHDGNPISATTATDSTGYYEFTELPAGTYDIDRGTVSEIRLDEGQIVPNATTAGTAVLSPPSIDAVILPENDASPINNFALIPRSAVGIAKQASTPVINADGSYTTTFSLVVSNLTLEPLINMTVTDIVEGADPLFGTYAALGTPATDAMTLGTYTILTGPSGSCGSTNAAFTGAVDTVVATGFSLAVDASCTLSFDVRVMPTAVRIADTFENQAVVDATGSLSGQTSATNPDLTDLSDDAVAVTANPDGAAGGTGFDDPTPVTPSYTRSIALIKTADMTNVVDPADPADIPEEFEEITYNFTVRNTGNTTLTNISIVDLLPGLTLNNNLIVSLAPGDESTLITGTYALTQTDINNGFVENTAEVTGTDPFGNDTSDDSSTDFTSDTPLVTPIERSPSLAITKIANDDLVQVPAADEDVISYAFVVTNTGNTTLTNVVITDPLTSIVLTGENIGTLEPGETANASAIYAIDPTDIENGEVVNQATATGTPPTGSDVTDLSGDTNDDDNPTVVPLTQAPSIQVEKFADETALLDGSIVGDTIPYTFTITNTGNIPLYDVTLTDLLPGVVVSGGPILVLPPVDNDPATNNVDTTTFTAEYTLDQDDLDGFEVVNTAEAEGFYDGGTQSVTDQDSITTPVQNIEAISEVFPAFTGDGGTTTSMLASDLLNGQPATLATVTIVVLDEPDGVTLDPNTGLITLEPGYPAGEYVVTYEIYSNDLTTLRDTTTETVVQAALPSIETTKTQVFTDDGDGRDSVGDLITYEITVENTGNVPVENLVLDDDLTDFDGGILTLDAGPDFDNGSLGSGEGYLEIGEIATYTASFTTDLQAVNAGGVENTVLATGLGVYGPGVPGTPGDVSDRSDDGLDDDGNVVDDPTVQPLDASAVLIPDDGIIPNVEMTKTTPDAIVTRGAVVPYTITITNENDFVVGPVDIVDRLPDGFLYVPGSAQFNGSATTVDVSGNIVTWDAVSVPAQGLITVSLYARVLTGADIGDHRNNVNLYDDVTGEDITADAHADVVILPEAIFDCGDVVGKVFADHNGNGYQDALVDTDRVAVSDQSYDGTGKGGKLSPEAIEPQPERGLPGVRLATVDGTVITTDENGLFSVPCAALPEDNGTNFILKVDDRSLPTGYRMTTENPRVMRLTPGMMTEMNFGAALGNVVRVDLNASVFVQSDTGVTLSAPFQNGVRTMLQQIAGDPVTIRLAYHVPADASAADVTNARVLLDMAEQFIAAEWRPIGRVPLHVEPVIMRAGQ
jgi:uncharacterized repeat protein (TIGR01451 family)